MAVNDPGSVRTVMHAWEAAAASGKAVKLARFRHKQTQLLAAVNKIDGLYAPGQITAMAQLLTSGTAEVTAAADSVRQSQRLAAELRHRHHRGGDDCWCRRWRSSAASRWDCRTECAAAVTTSVPLASSCATHSVWPPQSGPAHTSRQSC